MATEDPTHTTEQPDPNEADKQDPDAVREAQAEDPTSPERGFEPGEYQDFEQEAS